MKLCYEYLDGSPGCQQHPSPSRDDVESALRSLDWEKFASLQLTIDDENWLNGSGCLEPDVGLAMVLSLESVQHVSETAPDTPESMLPLFFAYLENDLDKVLALICDADRRGLTSEDLRLIHEREQAAQRNSQE